MLSNMLRAAAVATLLLLSACATQEGQKAPISAGTQGRAPANSLPANAQNVGTVLSIGDARVIDPNYPAQRGWQYARVAFGDSLNTARFQTAVAPQSLAMDVGDLVEVQPQANGALLVTRVLQQAPQQ
jgi:hypothetical protein